MPHRSRAADLIRDISTQGLADVHSFDELVEVVASQRPHGIEFVELPEHITGADNVFGLWLVRDGVDTIFHIATDSELHRQQIILHELAHMLLGHTLVAGVSSASVLMADVDPAVAHGVLMRGHEVSAIEIDAEIVADHLASIVRRSPPPPRSRFLEMFA